MPASTESQTCSDQSGCSYRWSPGAWGPYGRCSSTCGSGTQSRSRTVRCERSDGVGVADSFCSGQAKPEETESKACTDTSTCTYEWRTGLYGRWSDCSNTCGSGTQERTRAVTCTRSDGTGVADSYCREKKPESSERRICDSTRGWWVPLPSLPPPRPVSLPPPGASRGARRSDSSRHAVRTSGRPGRGRGAGARTSAAMDKKSRPAP